MVTSARPIRLRNPTRWLALTALALVVACGADRGGEESSVDPFADETVAEGIFAPLGEPLPIATPEHLEAFARGRQLMEHRFTLAEGLGPSFNTAACADCHGFPTPGGAADPGQAFVLVDPPGDFQTSDVTPGVGVDGVVRRFRYEDGVGTAPVVEGEQSVTAQRAPTPLYGFGLLLSVRRDEILSRADPDDLDGDGISGRALLYEGLAGVFGRKGIVVPVDGFVRASLFNHMGMTSAGLPEDLKRGLPFADAQFADFDEGCIPGTPDCNRPAGGQNKQASIPHTLVTDEDGVPDPEISTQELYDLTSYVTLLAAPQPEPPTEETREGRRIFDRIGCAGCHTPVIQSELGGLPAYTDLLVHDMGEELADGIRITLSSGHEFRTQPLWGVAAAAPYMHDGRASTLDEAVRAHGGESARSRGAYLELSDSEQELLLEFLRSLGGRDAVADARNIAPPADSALGGPIAGLDDDALGAFEAGRSIFAHSFLRSEGLGQPFFNGASCVSCHAQPVPGGAGHRASNVVRQALVAEDGTLSSPSFGSVIHRLSAVSGEHVYPAPGNSHFEQRQSQSLFGLGLLEAVPEEVVLANADADDEREPFGISGRAARTDNGRLGRFGWKADVPSLEEFSRDALSAELGLTVEAWPGAFFGLNSDADAVEDPEVGQEIVALLAAYIASLAPPVPDAIEPGSIEELGETLFGEFGCDGCHVPALDGPTGPVRAYTDLLVHSMRDPGGPGIVQGNVGADEFRTAPLWGVADTPPYMHDGRADTLEEAVLAHSGEATDAVDRFNEASDDARAALIAFLAAL